MPPGADPWGRDSAPSPRKKLWIPRRFLRRPPDQARSEPPRSTCRAKRSNRARARLRRARSVQASGRRLRVGRRLLRGLLSRDGTGGRRRSDPPVRAAAAERVFERRREVQLSRRLLQPRQPLHQQPLRPAPAPALSPRRRAERRAVTNSNSIARPSETGQGVPRARPAMRGS